MSPLNAANMVNIQQICNGKSLYNHQPYFAQQELTMNNRYISPTIHKAIEAAICYLSSMCPRQIFGVLSDFKLKF